MKITSVFPLVILLTACGKSAPTDTEILIGARERSIDGRLLRRNAVVCDASLNF